MSEPLKVGAEVEIFRIYGFQSRSEARSPLGRTKISGETPKFWILEGSGNRYDKKTLSLKPRYLDYDIFIRAVAP